MATLAVTGSTGGLGGRVAARLSAAGIDQRLIVRERSRAPIHRGAEVAQASYSDTDEAAAALEGIDVVFMVSGSENPDRVAEHTAFIDAAGKAGVEHVVYTSFYGASADSIFTLGRDHWATEEYIRASGMHFTFLRDNFYLDILPHLAGGNGIIRGPAGNGRVSAVARDDIAEVAVAVMCNPSAHVDATYDLTGPEALTMAEVAEKMTAVTGKTFSFYDETVEEAYASRALFGEPDWQVDAWVTTYTAIAAGVQEGISPDVQRITGHSAMSLSDLLDH